MDNITKTKMKNLGINCKTCKLTTYKSSEHLKGLETNLISTLGLVNIKPSYSNSNSDKDHFIVKDPTNRRFARGATTLDALALLYPKESKQTKKIKKTTKVTKVSKSKKLKKRCYRIVDHGGACEIRKSPSIWIGNQCPKMVTYTGELK